MDNLLDRLLDDLRAALRAYPTLLKVGFAEAVAYRAETVVWMLTNTMPLVNLALWSAVTRERPVHGYQQADLVAYFLSALLVRQLTSSWVLWEMSREIRMGVLSMRLLRPIHPLWAYSAENLSGLPLRTVFAIPVATIGIAVAGSNHVAGDAAHWLVLVPALLGAWQINFWTNALMGTLSFWLEQSMAVFQLWLGGYFILSGYMFPLDFVGRGTGIAIIHALPFYSMAGFPVEVLLGRLPVEQALVQLGVQWAWVGALGVGTLLLWRAGVRRYNAVGA